MTDGTNFERRRASGGRGESIDDRGGRGGDDHGRHEHGSQLEMATGDDTSTTDVVEMPDPDPRLPTPDIEHAPRLVATMADDIETFEHAPPRLEIVPPRVGEDAPQA